MGEIVAHAIYIHIYNIYQKFGFGSKIEAARNLGGWSLLRCYEYHFVIHVITPLRRGCGP